MILRPQFLVNAPDNDVRAVLLAKAVAKGYPTLSLPNRPSERVAAGEQNWMRFCGRADLADVLAVLTELETETPRAKGK